MGVYPAIDVPMSVSRVMNDIADGAQIEASQKFRRLVSLYLENRDLILMGGYTPGFDFFLDMSVFLFGVFMVVLELFLCDIDLFFFFVCLPHTKCSLRPS